MERVLWIVVKVNVNSWPVAENGTCLKRGAPIPDSDLSLSVADILQCPKRKILPVNDKVWLANFKASVEDTLYRGLLGQRNITRLLYPPGRGKLQFFHSGILDEINHPLPDSSTWLLAPVGSQATTHQTESEDAENDGVGGWLRDRNDLKAVDIMTLKGGITHVEGLQGQRFGCTAKR